ncbi:hypothetical protein IJ541_02775 [bacterium]|nr:hypothetical protein [bacterium]
MNNELKKLTSKNPKDFDEVSYSLINKPDVELFAQLVEQDDFLFDFVKQNVANRLSKHCNEKNYKNLLEFLKYYSPSYEKFIISTLAKFANEDLTDNMLEIFENGTDDEKTYCAKFFSYIKDPLAIEILNKNAFSQNPNLSSNCASTLAILNDKQSYDKAISMLDSNDDFTILDGVKFLISYGNKDSVQKIIQTMKKSSMAENIAGEILYLIDIFELYKNNPTDCLFIVNLIINGLGEILGLSQVFDYRLYEFFEMLINTQKNSKIAAVLINAIDKFDTLTENDEYLFDETKDTKQEIFDIKKLLSNIDYAQLYNLIDEELNPNSLFVYTALEFTENENKVRELLISNNQTLILKSLEILKQLESLTAEDKNLALKYVTDENIKSIIQAI